MLRILKTSLSSHRFTPRHHSQDAKTSLLNLLENMPKDRKQIAEAQMHRKKVKEKHSKYVPGKVTLQVLGTGAVGAPRSLYMFSDQSRYLFNCGEGTQRLAHEHKMKLAKLEHIFVTQPVWRNIGGLPGIALTIQDVGVPEITLHGPPGLNNIFTATKRFVVLKNLKINMATSDEDVSFSDNVMSVHYVPLLEAPPAKDDKVAASDTKQEASPVANDSPKESPHVSIKNKANTSISSNSKKSKLKNRISSSVDSSISNSDDEFNDSTDYYAYEHSADVGEDSKFASDLLEEQTKVKGVSMAYVCVLKSRPGALNLEKCLRMGVRPGPLLGKLKSGEDVKLVNGKIVTAKEVCEPDDPGLIFIVIDCPNVNYLDSLHTKAIFKKHQKTALLEKDIASVVIHFTPKEIVNNPRYQEWMEKFPLCTTHLMLNEFNTCMGSEAVHRIQYKLNLLSPDIFPLLGDKGSKINDSLQIIPGVFKKPKLADSSYLLYKDEVPDVRLSSLQRTPTSPTNSIKEITKAATTSSAAPGMEMMLLPRTFCTYHLRPKKGLDRSLELVLNPNEYVQESLTLGELQAELRKLKIKLLKKTFQTDDYPKLVFLGTGSCIPNKTRNTSGILLSLNGYIEKEHMLLDCGEGTYGQIIRFFGAGPAQNVLANLNAIYISHLHADHHIGLIGVLQGRRRALDLLKLDKRPLYLFAPKQIMTWLSFYDKCFENITSEFELVPNGSIVHGGCLLPKNVKDTVLNNLCLLDINTCLVKHCPNAFGVTITCRNGYKVTYSGDTMPCEALVALGIGSDILIHEATMEDELCHEATLKMHSTTNQAITIGKRMRAKHVILTHFSQRYAKLPRFTENFCTNVGIAFDNMQISTSDLSLMPDLFPALKLLFAEHYEELENKALKRQVKEHAKRKLTG